MKYYKVIYKNGCSLYALSTVPWDYPTKAVPGAWAEEQFPKMCYSGYHFCSAKSLKHWFTEQDTIPMSIAEADLSVFEIQASGRLLSKDKGNNKEKFCAKSIRLLRRLSREEIRYICKTGKDKK